jgi:tRNA A37 threonylcarbamoyladenosine synthetase subunit TsaC/SUA5/YrdC
MARFKSNTRLSRLSVKVILAQTDTTVGFLSQDAKRLKEIKKRSQTKPFIKIYRDFKALKSSKTRIPNMFKNSVRRAKKTTFIVKNLAFRVSKSSLHSQLLRDLAWHYSTSANESGRDFDMLFCADKADIIVQNRDGLHQRSSSSLYIINNQKRRKLR